MSAALHHRLFSVTPEMIEELKQSDPRPRRKMSITPEMLFSVWTDHFNMVDKENRVKLVHPNGWVLSLGRFRSVSTGQQTDKDVRVVMNVSLYPTCLEDFSKDICFRFDKFAYDTFGVDLDDCHISQLTPILQWMEKNKAQDF